VCVYLYKYIICRYIICILRYVTGGGFLRLLYPPPAAAAPVYRF